MTRLIDPLSQANWDGKSREGGLFKVEKLKRTCLQIRSKARALREKFTLESCSKDVQESAKRKPLEQRPQKSQFSQSTRPRQKFEAQGDLTGTPLHRWNSDKPQKSQQTPGRWQGSADSGKPSFCSLSILLGRFSERCQCLALSCIVIWEFKPLQQKRSKCHHPQTLSNQGPLDTGISARICVVPWPGR